MATPIAIAPLPLDTVVTGALRAGPTERFTVRDAGVVTVDSLVGDADLYLFGDADLAALTCASTTASLTVGVRGTTSVTVRAEAAHRAAAAARARRRPRCPFGARASRDGPRIAMRGQTNRRPPRSETVNGR